MALIDPRRTPSHPQGWGKKSKKKEPVAQVNIVQDAIVSVAKEDHPVLTLEFAMAWLQAREDVAGRQMNMTTGKDRAEWIEMFSRCSGAVQELSYLIEARS